MKIGIMSKEITSAQTIPEVFEKMKLYGAEQTQFSFNPFCPPYPGPDAVMERMPETVPDDMIRQVAEAARASGVEVTIVAGLWNMIGRDLNDRDAGLMQLERTMQACQALDCRVINICTGSKGAHMWCRSPENDTLKAWMDICRTMEQALALAEHYSIALGLEVEASNVINTPEKARRLIDDMASPCLKVLLDGANLFPPGSCRAENAGPILDRAFDLLGGDIVAVHGKDVKAGPDLDFTYCGDGIVDFPRMLRRLKALGYTGGIVLHGAHEEREVPLSIKNMRRFLEEA